MRRDDAVDAVRRGGLPVQDAVTWSLLPRGVVAGVAAVTLRRSASRAAGTYALHATLVDPADDHRGCEVLVVTERADVMETCTRHLVAMAAELVVGPTLPKE